MDRSLDVIAVLGRGIERVPAGVGARHWRPTSLVEKCKAGTFEHLGLRAQSADPNDPDCIIGGGNANVIAALQLFETRGAKAVLFAYGDRSKYLRESHGPLEGAVMKYEFLRRLGKRAPEVLATVDLRGGLEQPPGIASNTLRELENIFEFALANSFRRIAIIGIGVHVPRVNLFCDSVLAKGAERFGGLRVELLHSEALLLERSERYREHVAAMRASAAYTRNAAMEERGITAFREGKYKSVQDVTKK
jgi:hypothetical protein